MGISGDHKEVRETIVKIIQLLQNQNFDDDIEDNAKLFYNFSSMILTIIWRNSSGNEETRQKIKDYFESLSDEEKRTISDDLVGGDEQKRGKISRSLWRFDGDVMENTKQFAELLRDHNNLKSLVRVQKKMQDKKDIGEKNEKEYITTENKRVDDVVRRHKE